MYSDWVWSAIGGFLAVWLFTLSFFVWRQSGFLRSLFPKSGERDIRRKFEEVLKLTLDFNQDLNKLKDKLSEVEELGLKHIQRVQLSRYNPYQDSGGDQSFTAALLDEEGDGIVLTSLHARSGTRVFAKAVSGGKVDKLQFSEEEKLVVEKAMK